MMQHAADSYDSPWKDTLETYLEDFFLLFFPHIHRQIRWDKTPVSLEQELRKIVRDAELGTRFADKLFRVWTKDGNSLEVLINIEVQGNPTVDFAKRIYVYNYRIFDRFDRPVVSIAVLCDDSPGFHPTSFSACDLWGCRARLDFPTLKLREYNDRWAELEADTNPFATVVMAHLKTQATRRKPEDRYRWKLALIRRLYEKGYDHEDVIKLFRFLDWVMALPQELEERLEQKIEEIERERGMQYVTNIERRALQRGFEQGMQEGIEQGVQRGIEQGVQQGIQQGVQQGIEQGIERGIEQGVQQGIERASVDVLRRQLHRLHGTLPPWVEERLRSAHRDELDRWIERVLVVEALSDVFD